MSLGNIKKKKRLLALLLCMTLAGVSFMTGCGSKADENGSIFFLVFCVFFYILGIEYFICLDLFYFYLKLIPKCSPKYQKKSTFLFSYLLRFLNKMHFTLFSNIYHNSIMNFDYYK